MANLPAQILAAQTAFDGLSLLMMELQRAERTGNPDRIGNAAHDADMLAMELSAKLSAAFAEAAVISGERFEAEWKAVAA
jgi:hypothetical protein